ncbi:hypothetical protein O1611_g4489 [Lasiodiplodia mahajangana]|uniref:Uncharacterized protein n=1 Tax=Lasiodiplodia mahajangana TaxID=1108764 RepID=A0ACC2JNR8_9PEZI|nr:hypothetical protein O1611_g4489 [Lasiodiplodia mahajangana]
MPLSLLTLIRTKNCQLHLNLKYPGGFQFAVVESTYHGYAQLEKGVTGTFYSTYYFSQSPADTTTTQTSISGGGLWEFGDVYTKQDLVPTASVIWSPCGATGILNVNNRIALTTTNTTAYGTISDDDATVALTQQIHVAWQALQDFESVRFDVTRSHREYKSFVRPSLYLNDEASNIDLNPR